MPSKRKTVDFFNSLESNFSLEINFFHFAKYIVLFKYFSYSFILTFCDIFLFKIKNCTCFSQHHDKCSCINYFFYSFILSIKVCCDSCIISIPSSKNTKSKEPSSYIRCNTFILITLYSYFLSILHIGCLITVFHFSGITLRASDK